jgi:uncharacterized membrane protein SpoIIM required for sporulation/uncharacterized RDD family membrane protein YckC
VLELELAGLGSRLAAAVCDALILAVLGIVLALAFALVAGGGEGSRGTSLQSWYVAAMVLLFFLAGWGYFLLFEGLNGGRTPGKRYIGIRVVMDTGHPVTFAAAAVRNLVRIVDAQPGFSYGVGVLFVFFHPQNKRLGDLAAGTIVVRDRPEDLRLAAAGAAGAATAEEPLETGPPELGDDEYRLLDQLLDRLDLLQEPRRTRLIMELVRRFAPRFPRRDPDPEVFLHQIHTAEFHKRRGRLAARRVGGVGRTSVAAERFVARRQAAWEAFRAEAVAAERSGLKSLGAPRIPAFAARYREVAADLARARTYGVDPRVVEYLERVVSAGHNALYGSRGVARPRLGQLLLGELPAAVMTARAYVLTALLLFALPAVTGFFLVRERPVIVYEILPDEMIARAEGGRQRQAEAHGYAEAPSLYLPFVASRVVTNNLQVAFGAFAFGMTGGLGTIVLLVFNGLFFGAVLGLFANHGLAGWLLTFVAGHGVLELTAIFIAGGAGLLLARALIAPGDLTRRDALVVAGRTAVRMVGAAALLLCIAGTIEGFLSASDAAPVYKYAASALSGLFLFLYLRSGWTYLTRAGRFSRVAALSGGSSGASPASEPA